MRESSLMERITVNPKVMVGKPTIRGLRITVSQILEALANGISMDELLEDYPELEPEDIRKVKIIETILTDYSDSLPNNFCVFQNGRIRIRK